MRLLSDDKYCLDSTGFCYSFWSSIYRVDEHMHEYYEFFLIISGNALHTVNGIVQLLSSKTLCLIRPHDYHAYTAVKGDPFQMINVMITKKNMQSLFKYMDIPDQLNSINTSDIPPMVTLKQAEMDEFVKQLNAVSALSHTDPFFLMKSRLILSFVVYKIQFSTQLSQATKLPLWLNKTVTEMQRKENFVEGLPAMLRISGKTHEYLCRMFQKYFSCSPGAFITRQRLKHSEYLLLNTNFPIIDIALDCGFNSISHYNHMFKSIYQCAPTDFRKTNKSIVPDTLLDSYLSIDSNGNIIIQQ